MIDEVETKSVEATVAAEEGAAEPTSDDEQSVVETPAAAVEAALAEAAAAEAASVVAASAGASDVPADSPAQPDAVEGVFKEVDGVLVPDYDATITLFGEGDIVTGKVVRIDKDEVLVDIGYKSEGVIPQNELSIRKSVDPADEVEMGEVIDALVMQKEDADGRLILSKKRARFEKAWKRIEGAFESGTPVTGTVIEVVKGGLILDLGVRGFLPASLVDIRRVQDLGDYVGKELLCRVIEMNRNRNNVVLSRRAVLEEERREVRQKIIDELQVGMVVEGTISNIVDFGAFVDLDGIDGLIHISELSWTHINHPSEVLQVNQKVKVKVLDIDRDRQRISLGLKQTQEDPWTRIVSEHRVGDILEGRVTKLVAFGAFVEIYAGIEGLVHISELANRHVERPDEIVQVNEIIAVKIIEIDSDRRRLSLSIKRVDGAPMMRHPASEEVDASAGEAVEAEAGTDEPAAAEAAGEPAEAAAEQDQAAETGATEAEAVADVAAEEPADEEPAAEEPAAEEPAAEEPAAEEPAAEEPAAEEPAAEEPAAEEPAVTTAVGADEPTPELGLSDDVFPVGAEPADEKAQADDTPADDAEAAAGEEA
ncbi:MAG: 30S ribosomal protein S1 [Actinobacteria bacterium]|nr:30S ribosomal protein S1 [Actinomycetota bacterium]